MTAKYEVGQRVRVVHTYEGEWEGVITYRAMTDVRDGVEDWEYEVSNAPYDMAVRYPDNERALRPGNRWSPLLYEFEIVKVLD